MNTLATSSIAPRSGRVKAGAQRWLHRLAIVYMFSSLILPHILVAQDSTSFLLVAGNVKRDTGEPVSDLTIRVTNLSSGVHEENETDSLAESAPGFFSVTFIHFAGNTIAQVGDTILFEAFNMAGPVGVSPATTVLHPDAIQDALLLQSLTVEETLSIEIPPTVSLSFSSDSSRISPAELITVTATFSFDMATTQLPVSVASLSQLDTNVDSGFMQLLRPGGPSVFVYSFVAPSQSGWYSLMFGQLLDSAGREARPLTSSSFHVGLETQVPVLTIGSAVSTPGSTIEIPILFSQPAPAIAAGFTLSLSYNADNILFESYQTTDAATSSTLASIVDSQPPGTLAFTFSRFGLETLSAGLLASLQFRVAPVPSLGTTLLGTSDFQLADTTPSPMAGGLATDGTVSIGCGSFDADRNGRLNVFDILSVVNSSLATASTSSSSLDLDRSGGPPNVFDVLHMVNKVMELAPGGGRCP